jgi:hypothetical protein
LDRYWGSTLGQSVKQTKLRLTLVFVPTLAPKLVGISFEPGGTTGSSGGVGLAKAKGTAVVGMVGATPVGIKLSHPVEQCGHRVFSKARFRFPEFGTGSGMRLETCA